MPLDYDNKKIIPNFGDEDTRAELTISRIIARLPSLEGKAGKILSVNADEEGCSWVSGGPGGVVYFADILGVPTDNPLLAAELNSKITKNTTSPDFTLGVDAGGLYYEV